MREKIFTEDSSSRKGDYFLVWREAYNEHFIQFDGHEVRLPGDIRDEPYTGELEPHRYGVPLANVMGNRYHVLMKDDEVRARLESLQKKTPPEATPASTFGLSQNLQIALLRIPSDGWAITGIGDNPDDPDDNELERLGLATIGCDRAKCTIVLTAKGRSLQRKVLEDKGQEIDEGPLRQDTGPDQSETEGEPEGSSPATDHAEDYPDPDLVIEQRQMDNRDIWLRSIGLSSLIVGILVFVVTGLVSLSIGLFAFGLILLLAASKYTADPATLSRAARLRRGSIDGSDYPASALREGIEGTVVVEINIGADGRPVQVLAVESSKNEALDKATCNIIQRRFRYFPSLNELGEPIPSVQQQTVTWRVP